MAALPAILQLLACVGIVASVTGLAGGWWGLLAASLLLLTIGVALDMDNRRTSSIRHFSGDNL